MNRESEKKNIRSKKKKSKLKKKTRNRIIVGFVAYAIFMTIFLVFCTIMQSCGNKDVKETTVAEETASETTSKSQNTKKENPLLKCKVYEVDNNNVYGEKLGDRAYIECDLTFDDLSKEQIIEFGETTLKKYDDKNFDYFTIRFKDGKGITFSACDMMLGTYGLLDSEDMVEFPEYDISYREGELHIDEYIEDDYQY